MAEKLPPAEDTKSRNYQNYDNLSKTILQQVIKVCKDEKRSGGLQIPLSSPMERASNYTGVSQSTLYRLQRSGSRRQAFPRRTRKDKVVLDDFDQGVVRRTMQEILVHQKRIPTLNVLRDTLKEKIGYKGGKESLRKTLHQLGFSWKKTQSNRSFLMERSDIVASRANFLRQIKKYRDEGRCIVYTDETFIHTSHTVQKSWQSASCGLKAPISKGDRIIIVHAGSERGFIEGASLVFRSKSSTGDYHSEMNSNNFFKWVSEKLIPNLPSRSVLVVDNAPYHNLQHDRCPTQATRKGEIQDWLGRHGIAFEQKMLKAQLLELCKRNRPAPSYVLDNLLKDQGHDVLRLPAYHADLNAIELVWAGVKGYVARQNTVFNMTSLLAKTEEAISKVSAEFWRSCVSHVEKVEKQYWDLDIAVDREMDQIIIELHSSDEATDTADECGSSDTSSD